MNLSVMIQDRPSLFRAALVRLLGAEPGVSVDAVVATGAELLELAVDAPPDVIFVEIPTGPSDVIALLKRLSDLGSAIRLVGIGRPSERQHLGALCQGPLPPTAPFADLLRAAGIAESAPNLQERPPELDSGVTGPLSGRELRILSLLSAGQTTAQIAERLLLSHRSIRSSRERLLAKLDAQSAAQAVAAGIRHGFAQPQQHGGFRAPSRRPAQSYRPPQARAHRWRDDGPRVIVAHEIPIVAPGLRMELGGRAQIMSQTVFGAAAVALTELLLPHVVVASDLLADGVVEEFLPGLSRTGARVLVLTHELEGPHALGLLRQGASGLISLASSLDEVAEAVVRVARGEAVVSGSLADSLLRDWRSAAATVGPALTNRELEVLTGMADGLGTKAIARRLDVAYKTAENHKTRIFQKLGVKSQAEAMTLVNYRNGLSGSGQPDVKMSLVAAD